MEKSNLIMGLWKFKDSVEKEKLEEIANEWAKDDAYVLLFVRRTSKDQNGIGFARKYDGDRDSYDKYFDETSDMLKRTHGNDLVGWDISSNSYIIKGLEV